MNNKRKISVNSLYFYVNDGFQFLGKYNLFYWSKVNLDFSFYSLQENYINLTNDNFHKFRQRLGKGRDYLVLSKLSKIKDFQGYTFNEF